MHLWPTKTITESWRLPYMKNLERAISQKRTERLSQQEQNLLPNETPVEPSCNKLRCFFRDLVFVVTCCFCCGACMDEMDYYSSY